MPLDDLREQLEALLGAAGVAALEAWLGANGLAIVRMPS